MTRRNKDEDEDKDDGECNDNGDEGDAVFILVLYWIAEDVASKRIKTIIKMIITMQLNISKCYAPNSQSISDIFILHNFMN